MLLIFLPEHKIRGNKSCRVRWQHLFVLIITFGIGFGCSQKDDTPIINTVGEQPASVPTETVSDSQISEPLPAITNTPSMMGSIDYEPVQILSTPPQIYDYSVLTHNQKERLYRSSLTFLADTEEEAIGVAKDLNYVNKFGHPATFCGPLSIGILQKAGLVDRTVSLHDFWLLNPRDEYSISTILEKTFPPEDYLWFRTKTPLNEFDFTEFPLYTGDFVYIYAGPRGTFEHMLTVTRVDETGRAYAVSAELYSGSYSISEVMLYDPQNSEVGFFYDLTNIKNMYTLGVTGFGGFQLWRPLKPIPDLSVEQKEFQENLDSLINTIGGEWYVQVKEVGGETLYKFQDDVLIHPGSVIKVPLAILFFDALHSKDIVDLGVFLDERGVESRTYRQLLEAILVYSEEEATERLLEYTKNEINIDETLQEWGYSVTSLSPRRTTVAEITKLFENLWLDTHISHLEGQIIRDYLEAYTSGDDSRIGVIRKALPEGVQYFSKRGSLAEGRVIVAEVAVLETESKSYVLSIFAYPERGKTKPTYDALESSIETAAWLIWDYIKDPD